MTTAGRFVENPLGKAQCTACGAIQKVFERRLADTDFYEKSYSYYSRPGSERFDHVRYEALAGWVASALDDFRPKRALDIGCGRGWTMSALQAKFADTKFVGLEPTVDAVDLARAQGLDVRQGRLGEAQLSGESFDLIYSNNVLQHTTNPAAFLAAHVPLLADGGYIVLSCPDGSMPSVELMMADQNFSLAPRHLAAVCDRAGLLVEKWFPCPGGPLRHEQLVVMRKQTPEAVVGTRYSSLIPQGMADHTAFVKYINAWDRADEFICRAVEGSGRILNFGGGLWSYVLAAYCPEYWRQVECCLVDGFAGHCIDKEVLPAEQFRFASDDAIVVGTNPYVQERIVQRFAESKVRAVSWQHLIPD